MRHPLAARLATTLSALCDFLSEPSCRQCEVLEICFKHLQTDASEHRPSYPRSLLRSLRRVPPFSVTHRRCDGRRCVPAELLATYLTPGEEVPPYGTEDQPALSWVAGEQDVHW